MSRDLKRAAHIQRHGTQIDDGRYGDIERQCGLASALQLVQLQAACERYGLPWHPKPGLTYQEAALALNGFRRRGNRRH